MRVLSWRGSVACRSLRQRSGSDASNNSKHKNGLAARVYSLLYWLMSPVIIRAPSPKVFSTSETLLSGGPMVELVLDIMYV